MQFNAGNCERTHLILDDCINYLGQIVNRGLIKLDNNLVVNEVNSAAEQMLDVNASQILGKSIKNFPQNVNLLALEHLIKNENFRMQEIKCFRMNKEIRLLVDGKKLQDFNGRSVGFIFVLQVLRDEKEMKSQMENIDVLNQQYSFIIEKMRRGVVAVDNQYRVTLYNKAAERILGVSFQEFYGKDFFDAIPIPRENFITYQTLRGKEYVNQYHELTLQDIQLKLIVDSKTIYNQNGEKIGAVTVFDDISDRIELEKKAKKFNQMERQQSFILDSMNYGVIGVDENYIINLFNKGAEKIINKAADEMLGKHLIKDFPNVLEGMRLLEKTLTTGEEYNNYPFDFVVRDKSYEFLINTMLMKDETGAKTGAVILFADVSELRRQEQFLAQHESMSSLSRMAAGLAHEIRNPLTSIKGFVQLLQSKIKEGIEYEYLDIILEELNRTNHLLGDFMLMAKPRQAEFKDTDLGSLLGKTVEFMKAQAVMNDIEIKTRIAPDLPRIKGNAEQLKQVYINLIRNSIEAIPGKGTIWIEAVVRNQQIELIFSDSGIGIPSDKLEKIFEVLYTTKDTGTGLGLPVCNQIIKHHGGSLEVSSIEGKGAAFTIRIPVK